MFKYGEVTFSAVEQEDLETLWEMRQDENINDNLFTLYPISMAGQMKWLDSMLSSKTQKVFMVDYEVDDYASTIGCVRLADIDHLNRKIEVGADIIDEHRGKGYGHKVYQALCKYCFDYLNVRKIYLYVLESNETAIHVYKKQGFKKEALLKKHVWKHGAYQNVLMMSIIK